MAGLLSSLFGGQSNESPASGPESNEAYAQVSPNDPPNYDEDEGSQSAQSFQPSFQPSSNNPADGGAGDDSVLGPPSDAYLESQ